uniref:C2H2-type domain-containing protein n=1 Tax=Mucochytrium quahogii TaxID=96639 RepID=A0A7S2WN43_9STRA|mmetsp:Transcript_16819/g.27257  ORF Transcript_16819/g.27257 Transcript_16819/m.27257 type:complete len:270 (-) Transcript_16819:2682-3491(-)
MMGYGSMQPILNYFSDMSADIKKPFSCDTCGKGFHLHRSLQRHIVAMHESKTYVCKTCKKEFTQRNHLKMHNEEFHSSGRVPCSQCDKTFTTKSSLRLHIEAIHEGVRYKCSYCQKTFGQMGSLRRHLNTIHAGVPVTKETLQNSERVFGQSLDNVDHSNRNVSPNRCDSGTDDEWSSFEEPQMRKENGETIPFLKKKRIRAAPTVGRKALGFSPQPPKKLPKYYSSDDESIEGIQSIIVNRFPKYDTGESRAIAILVSLTASKAVSTC